MGKIRLNDDPTVVARIKAGLKQTGGYSTVTMAGSLGYLAERVRNFRLIKSAAPERESGAPVPELCSDIIFDNVSFAYNEDREVLKDISLNIPMGKVTAIIGGTVRENMTYGLDREVSEAEGSPAELERSNEYYRLFKKTL